MSRGLLSLLTLLVTGLNCHAQCQKVPSSGNARTEVTDNGVVEQLFAAWSSHDSDRVVAFYTDDIAYEDVPLGRTSRGKTELRKFVEDTFSVFPDLKVELVRSFICDGHGMSDVVWSATDKGFLKTDKKFSVRMASVFELHEGKISRNEDFYDLSTITRQLGALPADELAGQKETESRIAADAKQQVLRLGKEWAAAEVKHDASTLRHILDDKFVASFDAKKPYDKEAFIKEILAGDDDPTESQTLTDETVVIDHDTAVVVGTDTVRGTDKGAAYAVVFRYTVTYIRRHGAWVALAEHLVEVPQAK
jgi:steroid delta-isomerase-like uncharacterized protein